MGRRALKGSSKRRPVAGRVSLRALARHLDVSEAAVRKGVKSGRLSRSIGSSKGRPVVLDVATAALEWAAGATKPRVPRSAPSAPASGGSLVDAQLRVARARAMSIRLLNRQRSGRLISAEAARREAFESARSIRDAVLAVPDRLSAELAAEPDAARVHARLRAELMAALEMVAEVLARGA